MKKLLIAAILCTLALIPAYAGTKDKKESKEKDINVNIHIDKDGEVHINAKNISEKDIEKWVSDHLKNISIDINDDDVKISSQSDGKGKKDKTVQLSLTIKEK